MLSRPGTRLNMSISAAPDVSADLVATNHATVSPENPDLRSSRPIATWVRLGIGVAALLAGTSVAGTASAKPFEEYIKPTPTVAPLSSATWGVAGVLPRDISNGIESAKGAAIPPDYYYWDGQVIKAKDGKYHLFHSTWAGSTGFQNWGNSDAFHSVSEQGVLGPYKRQDYVYSSHRGHNVSAAELPDGSYVVIVSEIVPFQLFKSSSLDGPWTSCSPQSDIGGSNISFFPRHDGKFEITERHGGIAIADTLCGHYVRQKPTCAYPTSDGNSVYPKRTSTPGVPNPSYAWEEDPHIWRSGGTYHIIYSGSGDRVGWHLYSPDGLSWKDNGYAWSPRDFQKIFCYEGSTTCTAWYKMERPSVVLQDGHPTHVTWAVSDVDKDNQIPAGSNHGSKVIVVPFDGVAFDNDFGTGGGDAGVGGDAAGGAPGTGGTGAGGGGGKPSGGAGGSAAAGGRSGAGGTGGGSGGASTGGKSGSAGAGGTTGGNGGTGGTEPGNTGGSSGGGVATSTPGSGGGGDSGGRASGVATSTAGSGGAGSQAGGGSVAAGGRTMSDGKAPSGCSCSVQGHQPLSDCASLFVLGFALLSLARGRRRL
jgi:hypothetical protein